MLNKKKGRRGAQKSLLIFELRSFVLSLRNSFEKLHYSHYKTYYEEIGSNSKSLSFDKILTDFVLGVLRS
jgi:hypothetical protein